MLQNYPEKGKKGSSQGSVLEVESEGLRFIFKK